MSSQPAEERGLLTQEQTAQLLGVTRQYVQQCEAKLKRKLREALLEFPEVREWLDEQRIEIDDEQDAL